MWYNVKKCRIGECDMDLLDALALARNRAITVVPDETRFWMIRTKKGYFYNEFIKEGFVALGWNIIDRNTDFSEQSIDTLKEYLTYHYGEDRPMGPVNKCKNFMYEIQAGDILLIPNSGSSAITLAKAGEYYEDIEKSSEKEIEVIAKIENHEYEINSVECPYKKRRHIEVLCTVDPDRLSYKLRRAISSYHGISCFDEYAEDILCCIYDGFSFLENVIFSINVSKKDPIRPREISKLMYGLTEFFCEIVDEEILSTTISLNSPGKVTVKLRDGFKYLTTHKKFLIGLFFLVTGGSCFGFEFPGVIGFVKDVRCMETEIEIQKTELQGKELDNILKAIEVVKEAKENGIDIDKVCGSLEILNDLNTSLQFQSNKEFETATMSNAIACNEE